MGVAQRRLLDLLFPEPWVIQRHMENAGTDGPRDLLSRLLELSREYEVARRKQPDRRQGRRRREKQTA